MKNYCQTFATRMPVLLALFSLSPWLLFSQLVEINGPTQVCPGAIVDYSAPLIATNTLYTWTAPPGSLINGQPSPYTIDAPNGLTVQVTFGQVGGNICLTVEENGDQLGQGCIQVQNQPIPPTVLPPLHICFEDAPYYWDPGGIIIYNSGVYDVVLQSYLGCDSVVKQQIIINPPIYSNIGVITLSPGDCYDTPQGNEFCNNGTFSEVYESYLGCDSFVVFSIVGGGNCNLTASIAPPEELNCDNTQVTLYATSNSPNATYLWSTPQGFAMALQNPVVQHPGTYGLTVTDPTNGCTAVAFVTVVANILIPVATLDTFVLNLTCADNEQQVHVTLPSGGDYSWEWTGPSVHPGNKYSLDPEFSQEGVYRLFLTDNDNGCTSEQSVFVFANGPFPVASAGPDLSLNCQNAEVRLNGNASSSGPNISILWTGPGITNNATQRRPWVNAPGLYKIYVTDNTAGCTKVDYAYVQNYSTPPTADAGSDQVLDCGNSTGVQLNASGSTTVTGGNFMRLWAGPGIDSINRNQLTPTVSVPGNYQLTITEIATGCTDTDEVVVTAAQGLPVASAGPDRIWSSGSPDVTLDGSGSSSGPGFKYVWSGPGITNSNKNLQNPVVNVPGRYVLRVYELATNCNARDRVLVIDSGQTNSDALESDEDVVEDVPAAERNAETFNPFAPVNDAWQNIAQIRQWLVCDSRGVVVLRASDIEPAELPLLAPLQHQPSGMYFWHAEVLNNDGTRASFSGKFVH